MTETLLKIIYNRSPFVAVNIGEQRHLPASNANTWVENKQAARPVCKFVHQQASGLDFLEGYFVSVIVRNLS